MAENNSEKKLPEANFEVSSLAEVKDQNGNGVFHLRTKTKFILVISILILIASGALIYLTLENYFAAEIWQLAVWGLCGVLAIYSIFAKSIPTMLLNLILFFGVSLIPVWQAGHETFKPVIEKFTQEPAQENQSATDGVKVESEKNSADVKTENAPVKTEPAKTETENATVKTAETEVEKVEQPEQKETTAENSATKIESVAENPKPEIEKPQQKNSPTSDLPRI